MLNVKERLPDGTAFKFLFHFPEVIRVKCQPDDPLPQVWQLSRTGCVVALRG